ncbi:uncharacterized protein KRP23_12023 [Phytophthora ramorum]|uniref:uncharacterized protein n=1 Tax=Phytophthora ramorum TaxID=164328 RepID=UPI0030A54139|nr:hypothetical protein KRP23_12023 [Phytophthora ramorum]
MKSKPEQDDYYLRETLLEHGRSTDHNGIVVGSWKTEFFDCFDDWGSWQLYAPWCRWRKSSKRLGLAPYSLVITVYLGLYLLAHLSASLEYPFFIFVCVAAGMASVMWVAIPIGVILLRVHIRELFSIPGNIAEDVVLAFVCGPCAIAQMATRMASYEPGTCSFGPRATLEGYVHQ